MARQFENYLHSFWKNDKPFFVPNEFGEKLGKTLKRKIGNRFTFDKFIYHFKDGSHVAALHRHRHNHYFCRIDLKRFFYTINRNRVKRALKSIGIPKPEFYARWSTVKNPFGGSGYVVPYGFVQSPIVATLVLAKSPIGIFLRNLPPTIAASVYMDDICLSAMDEEPLREAFKGLLKAVEDAAFTLNGEKLREPAQYIDIFNCSLENGLTEVLPNRIAKFHQEPRTAAAEKAFEEYCDIVKSHTWRVGAKRRKKRLYFQARRRAALTVPTPATAVAIPAPPPTP
ncbi:UNVERIFIED_ORG: hypothetical protein GGE64_000696 [Rhizobium etli]